MKHLDLRAKLINYMKKNHSVWVPAGQIERDVMKMTKHTGSYARRQLRFLEKEGKLKVTYKKFEKGIHAFYRVI